MPDEETGSGKAAATTVGGPAGNLAAIGAMLLSTVFYTCSDAAMKFVAGVVPTGEAVFLRSVGVVLLLSAAAFVTGALSDIRAACSRLMCLRGAADAGNSLMFQAALARMPLADTMGILQLSPLALTAASSLVLGATVGWRRWMAVAAGLAGALLVIKPGTSAFNVFAILAIISVLCGTVRDVSTRSFPPGLSPLLILIVSQAIVALCALGGLTFERWVWPAPHVMLQLVAGSALIGLGHLFTLLAVRHSDLAVVAPFRYAGIVWAILLGFAFWGEWPDRWTLTGIAILITAGLYTFHRERLVVRGSARPTEKAL